VLFRSNIESNLSDTAKVNRLLNSQKVKDFFPFNMKFLWDVKPIVADDGNEFLALYPIKKGRNDKPPVTGEVVINAWQDFDERDRIVVNMLMNGVGTKKWRKFTLNNIGNRCAIVLDNYVYSAPVILTEITNGRSSITGDFTIEEAKDLANILISGSLLYKMEIINENFTDNLNAK